MILVGRLWRILRLRRLLEARSGRRNRVRGLHRALVHVSVSGITATIPISIVPVIPISVISIPVVGGPVVPEAIAIPVPVVPETIPIPIAISIIPVSIAVAIIRSCRG